MPEAQPASHLAHLGRRKAPLVAMIAAALVGAWAFSWLVATGLEPGSIDHVAANLNQDGATGGMNGSLKSLIGLSLLGAPLILPLVALVWLYNGMVDQEEQVYGAWAQVEASYQRRSDLIPNLVRTVTRYMDHERDTLVAVTAARTAALQPLATALDEVQGAEDNAQKLLREGEASPEADLERLAAAQLAVERSLGRLFGVVEAYPELRAADPFLELQAQLEGSENRINVARVRFNQSVEAFNRAIRRLPGSLVAGLGDFRRKAYFQAEDDAAQATQLRFD